MSKVSEGGTRVVVAALLGNTGISVAKFVAAVLTGSASMLAEAVHSVADTGNQALLLLGMRLAKRHDPDRYPLGRHKEVYFWAFVVALMLFSLGGVHAIYQGVHKLRQGHEEAGPVLPSVIVLGISVVLEFSSFAVAWREFRKANANRRLGEALFGGRDPTVTVVLLEDTGALLGLAIALCAVVWSHVSKSSAPDAIGSIVIGVLLCAIGVALAAHTHSLLLGVTATPEMRRQAEQIAQHTEGVEAVTQLLTMHLGPDAILLALKVRFRAGMPVEDVERVTDSIEARVRAELPQMQLIFVEVDGHYDAALDPAMHSKPAPRSKRITAPSS